MLGRDVIVSSGRVTKFPLNQVAHASTLVEFITDFSKIERALLQRRKGSLNVFS